VEAFFSGRMEKENQKPVYIFGGSAPEQKSHNTERSRGKRQWK
jgi:5'-3' exonuclease